ncbi:hypothetical protein ACFWC9_23495 [Streptomyces goshikiensis]
MLRHDLGVEVDPHFEQARMQMLAALNSARDSLAHALATERSQAT